MPDLRFNMERVEVEPFAIAPQLAFKLRLTNNTPDEAIHTVALRAQIQIEATRRPYTSGEQESLQDLFGEADRWAQTLKTFLWTHTSLIVPAFHGKHRSQLAGSVYLRFQCRLHEVFCRSDRRGHPGLRAIQRNCVLQPGWRRPSGISHSVGQGSSFQTPGRNLEEPDGHLLSGHGVAMPGSRCL